MGAALHGVLAELVPGWRIGARVRVGGAMVVFQLRQEGTHGIGVFI